MGNFINSVINKVKGKPAEDSNAESVSAEQVANNAQESKVEPVMVDPKKSKHGGDVCCGSCGG